MQLPSEGRWSWGDIENLPLISGTWPGKMKNLGANTLGPLYPPLHARDKNIHRFWRLWGFLEPIYGYQEISVLMGASLLPLYVLTTLCSSLSQPLPPYLRGSWTSHVVAIGSESKGPKRDQQMLHPWPYLTCSWKTDFITSTVFCSLTPLKRALPLRGKDIVPAFWWKEGQENYSHVFKLLLRYQSTS